MKKRIALLLTALTLMSFSACNPQAENANTRVIIDSAGDEVTIPNEVDDVINLVTYGCQVNLNTIYGLSTEIGYKDKRRFTIFENKTNTHKLFF